MNEMSYFLAMMQPGVRALSAMLLLSALSVSFLESPHSSALSGNGGSADHHNGVRIRELGALSYPDTQSTKKVLFYHAEIVV